VANEMLGLIAFSLGILLGVVGVLVAYVVDRGRASAFRPIDRPLPPPRRAPALLQGLFSHDADNFRALPHQTETGVAGPLCWTCGRPKNVGAHPNC
jgi:hypothetical protein